MRESSTEPHAEMPASTFTDSGHSELEPFKNFKRIEGFQVDLEVLLNAKFWN